MTATATIWRTCPVCGATFEQPDDPGRKRVYCSRACQQAAYRARQRSGRQDQRHGGDQQRQDNDDAWWRARERYQRANGGGNDAGQRHQRRQDQRQQPPNGANGQRPGATSSTRPKVMCSACGGLRARHTVHHDQAAHQRARRRHDALLHKAAATTFEHEAEACRTKAEAMRAKYGL